MWGIVQFGKAKKKKTKKQRKIKFFEYISIIWRYTRIK